MPLNADAVKQIFVAKGRPLDNPMIVHIASVADLERLTTHVPEEAEQLYWKVLARAADPDTPQVRRMCRTRSPAGWTPWP